MDGEDIIKLRKEAEAAVADIGDRGLKLKPFEVILNHLLARSQRVHRTNIKSERTSSKKEARQKPGSPASTIDRILSLQDDGFFKSQRSISDVRNQLKARGWHYPVTTLSGKLQELVQQRKLRRERMIEGKKKIWKYSDP